MDSRKTIAALGLAALAGWAAAGAEEKQLTAREMFYAAPAAAKTVEVTKPVTGTKPKTTETITKRKSSQKVAQSKSTGTETMETPKPPERVETARRQAPETGKIVTVAYGQKPPLGVRYSLLKRTESGQVEVDPAGVFRAGDRIRVNVEVNDTAYLYIVNRGSSGAWKVLFPAPEIQGGDNRVEPGRRYQIPAEHVFTFDEQPGVEKLFLVLSRQPEPDLENLIYSLSKRPGSETTPAAPPYAPPPGKTEKILLAANLGPIDDSLIGRMRNTYARDLIIEKVDEATPGPKKEHAVYVVNTTGRDDSRVVVDIDLNHQ